MLPLPTEFEDRLFRYGQVEREGDLAIFTQEHKASGIVRYEVVLIRVQKEHTWPTGVTTPEKEAYPASTRVGDALATPASPCRRPRRWPPRGGSSGRQPPWLRRQTRRKVGT